MLPSLSWSFPPFRLDTATGSLWRDAQLVPLPPKPLAVLAALVAQAGQVVTKEALLDAVWPDTAVTEGVLKGCIRQIRQVLGETAEAPQYIATVHRRGYRFVAPVTPVAASAEAPTPAGVCPHRRQPIA
jgi:DNA-binding winged helix-turn-helix (wHTH) protein